MTSADNSSYVRFAWVAERIHAALEIRQLSHATTAPKNEIPQILHELDFAPLAGRGTGPASIVRTTWAGADLPRERLETTPPRATFPGVSDIPVSRHPGASFIRAEVAIRRGTAQHWRSGHTPQERFGCSSQVGASEQAESITP